MSIRIPRLPSTSRKAAPAKKPNRSHPHFEPAALDFLKKLARNNRREWFQPRKPVFDEVLRAPMLALCAALLDDMMEYAPNHLRQPEKCVMRIYRDTRFSSDKTPYKRNVAAWFAAGGLEKTSGAGFYFHLSKDELVVAAGCYMPERDQLLKIRTHLLQHHAQVRRLLDASPMKRRFTRFEGLELTRAPKGFPPDHPGMDLIRCRQWGVGATLPAEIATTNALFAEISSRFRQAAPLVHLLNQPLLAPEKTSRQSRAFHL